MTLRNLNAAIVVAAVCGLVFCMAAGCDQGATGITQARQGQEASAPTRQEQGLATYGGHTVRIDNRQTDGLPLGGQLPVDDAADRERLINASLEAASLDGITLTRAMANLIQIQVYNLDTAASTTPTGSQASTPQVAGTQTGTQTPTLTSTPRLDPAITGTVAAGLPGSAVQASGSAGSGGGTATTDAQATQTATAQILETLASDTKLREEFLRILTQPEASTNGL